MDRWVAAVDGGGTKTQAAIVDQAANVEVFPMEAGCNPMDNPDWLLGLSASLEHLGPMQSRLENLAFGLPGYSEVPSIDAEFHRVISDRTPASFSLSNDVQIAHIGAFGGEPGTLILAGTGSMCLTGEIGQFIRIGGLGETFGDEGSAYWIGRQALSVASQMQDGRLNATSFASALRLELGLNEDGSALDLLVWLEAQPHQRSAIAGLAKSIDDLATKGDMTAISLLEGAADELFKHLAGQTPTQWSYAGSVFKSQIVRDHLSSRIGASPSAPILPPLGGGLLLAARQAQWDIGADWINALAKNIKGEQNDVN